MTEAAATLNLTQPAISRAIAMLEKRLNAELLERSSRPLKPTAAGRRLLDVAERLLNEAAMLPGIVRGATRQVLPQLRLGVLDSLADPFVPKVIGSLKEIAKSLNVTTGFDAALRESFLRHELDAVVSTSPYDELSGFVRFELLQERFIVVVPATAPVFADDDSFRRYATNNAFIRLGSTSSIATTIERHLRRIRLEIPESFACNTIESVVGLVASGVGWSILTPVCVRKCLHLAPSLRLQPLPGPAFSRNIFLAARKSELDPHAERVAEICRRVLKTLYVRDLTSIAPWIGEALLISSGEAQG